MYSTKLDALIAEHPDWRKPIKNLFSLIRPGKEYPFSYLVDHFAEVSPQKLSLILSELASQNILDRIVRVESPETGGGIGDFKSILEVPDEILDFRTQKKIQVTPDNVVTLFRAYPEAA